jgi:triphosphatase
MTSPSRAVEVAVARGMEIEVKLSCPKDIQASLFDHAALAAARIQPRAQRLTAVYFDTADDALERAGLSLRVRRTRARRIMTLKWTLGEKDPFARCEAEALLPDENLNIELFETEVAARVIAAAGGEILLPKFETRVRRRSGELRLGETLIEIALDDGEIVVGQKRSRIAECEFELKEGDPATLFSLAAQLTNAGLTLNPLQKSQRGYLLGRGEKPSEVRAVPSRLEPTSSIEDVIGVIIGAALSQFLRNWPALLDADCAEAIHQMRVALRRLRAALRQFERAFPGSGFRMYRESAKRLSNALGPAREQDVLIALSKNGPLAAFPSEPSIETLLSAFESQRRNAYSLAKEVIRAPETSRFVLELQAFVASRGWRNKMDAEALRDLGRPAKEVASELLELLYQRARKLGKNILTDEPEDRHRLRIVLQNLRYSSEFFISFYDAGRVKKFNKTVAVLQEALGAHNDSVSALRLIQQNVVASQTRAAAVLMGWCAHEISMPEIYLGDHWSSFKNARCFWR